MRVIKFKGKSSYHGEWVYGNLIVSENGEKYVVESDYFEEDGHHLACNSDTPVFTLQDTIGQFTGLLDKNEVEIYEGDKVIVNCDDEEFGIVVWDNEESEYEIDSDGCRLKLGCFYSRNLEVIGNIHDDPELA